MKSPKTVFREYFRERLRKTGAMPKGEDFEDFLAECSADWENEPCAEYGGKTPREYFGGITDPDELARIFEQDVKEGGEPLAVIADRLAGMPEAKSVLCRMVSDGDNENVREAAADILHAANEVPVSEFAEIIFDPDTPAGLRERLTDILSQTDNVCSALAWRIDDAEGTDALILAEILVESGAVSDGVFSLLMRLTDNADTLPRALQLIASYGDDRALPRLKEVAETCDYAMFTDVRSAVEALGGELDCDRDWSSDATFAAIKGNKEGK